MMLFDDRLATVLRQTTGSEALSRIVFRQLLDLLGTCPVDATGPRIDAAYLRLNELSNEIPAARRAAILAEPDQRLRSPRLVAALADSEPSVASAALRCASLSEEQWLDLIPALPVRARGLLRHQAERGARVTALLDRLGIGDRALPAANAVVIELATASKSDLPGVTQEPRTIGAIVRRIEEFRKARPPVDFTPVSHHDAPQLPLGEDQTALARSRAESFDFATDAEGRIVWAQAGIAPMVAGLRIAARDAESPLQSSQDLLRSFRLRLPVRGAALSISGAPAVAGDWLTDAAPRFDQPGGRFVGYAGRMRRPPAEAVQPEVPAESEADRMRQVLHELRTPVNAIQGFAEIIQQQLFGPAPHEYRALAAAIAGDSARILAGFEELDRLVRLDSGALAIAAGEADIAAVVTGMVAQLEAYTAPRGSGFESELDPEVPPAAMARPEAERLIWRLLAAIAGSAAPGEMLRLQLRRQGSNIILSLMLPAQLAARSNDSLFEGGPPSQAQALSTGMFGTGFSLRLVMAEARAAGGALERHGDELQLSLPGLTGEAETHSDGMQQPAA